MSISMVVGGLAQGAGNAALGAGMAVQGASTALTRLVELMLSPVTLICDWAREPLKDRDIARQIKKETEVVKIIADIEQLKKDKEFERMKAVSDAMMRYQIELTRVNVEAVESIGLMRIELQRKAYDLIQEKTREYAELQEQARILALKNLSEIDSNTSLTEDSKYVLRKITETIVIGIVQNALIFIENLNRDMQNINEDIKIITSSGQSFIERHLSQFQLIGFAGQDASALNTIEQNALNYNQG